MIPRGLERHHFLQAAREIDAKGVPSERASYRYDVILDGKAYPPKYLISVATRIQGKELRPQKFTAVEAKNFFRGRGYKLVKRSAHTSGPTRASDEAFILLTWRDLESDGYTDVFPKGFFATNAEAKDHDVVGRSGGITKARCRVTAGKDYADLDYEPFPEFNRRHRNVLGVARITFTDAARNAIRRVEWRPAGTRVFHDAPFDSPSHEILLNRKSSDRIAKIFSALLPDETLRRVSLERIAASVALAEVEQPGCWSLTCIKGRVRLNVGKIETLALVPSALHLITWKANGPSLYESVPGSMAVDLKSQDLVAGLARTRGAHEELVRRAARTAKTSPWASAHSNGALRYIADALGVLLPAPIKSRSATYGPQDSSELPSIPNIDQDAGVQEGGAKWVLHLCKERDRSIIDQKKRSVLNKTGRLVCEACDLDFDKFYGVEYCEVHHLKPLAVLEGTTNTSERDLAILCANCHRAIHRAQPLPTINEFRTALIGRNKANFPLR